MNKCPPGVICIGNVTIFSIILVLLAFCVFMTIISHNNNRNNSVNTNDNYHQSLTGVRHHFSVPSISTLPFLSSVSSRQNVLLDPHTAPLRDDTVDIRSSTDPRGQPPIHGIPINVPTQSVDTEYRQVGILTRKNGPEMILPLMGRPLFTNRDKWQFYTMSDRNPNLKLPLSNGGKSCTGEYGCDNLGNGDSVFVEGYNDAFKVTSYENNSMKYIPFI